jgi:uncharacterized protein (UPF0332 family)
LSASHDHFQQARENRALAERLLAGGAGNPTDVQWVVVAAFYCAVHCIQGYLLTRGHDPRNHASRGALVASPALGIPGAVQDAYFWLKMRSERARYRLGRFDPSFVRQRVLDDKLKLITDFVKL